MDDLGLIPYVQPPAPASSTVKERTLALVAVKHLEGFAGRAILGSLLLGLGHSWSCTPSMARKNKEFPLVKVQLAG